MIFSSIIMFLSLMWFGIGYFIGYYSGKNHVAKSIIRDLKGYKLIKGLDAIKKEKNKQEESK